MNKSNQYHAGENPSIDKADPVLGRKKSFYPGTRPLIVYLAELICSLSDDASDVPRNLWESIRRACADKKCNFLSIVSGERSDGYLSVVYDLFDPSLADGYIFWTQRTDDIVEESLNRFSVFPSVSISIPHAGLPASYVTNQRGMRDLMAHLISYHGYRKIAFIRGPEYHPAAEQRFSIYRESLESAGIAYNADIVTPPKKWHTRTGKEGIRYFLDEKSLKIGSDIDAIVCPSDRIAIGACKELQNRGFSIPQDVALTGFNNLQDAQGLYPSLTTVATDFTMIGEGAVAGILSQIKSDDSREIPTTESLLVVGESCGCANPHVSVVTRLTGEFESKSKEEIIENLVSTLRAVNPQMFAGGMSAKKILDAFTSALAEDNPQIFISAFVTFFRVDVFSIMELIRWQDVLSAIRANLSGLISSNSELSKAEYVLDVARVAMTDYFSRAHTRSSMNDFRCAVKLHQISGEMGIAREIHQIASILSGALNEFGISFCAMVCYDEPVNIDKRRLPKRSRLMLYSLNGGKMILPSDGLPFESARIIPAKLPEIKDDFLLLPLIHDHAEYGYLLLSVGVPDGNFYDSVAECTAGAISNVIVQHKLDGNKRELEKSLRELRKTQKKLIESEKMAAMGELVAGVAHEINTPLGIGVTLISNISQRSDSLRDSFRDSTPDSISSELSKISESAEITMRNLQRAVDLVESFKNIAVDQVHEDLRKIEIGGYVGDVIRSIESFVLKEGHHVEVSCPQRIEIRTYPGSIAQIMTNLVKNSVVHGFESKKSGYIWINCTCAEGFIQIEHSDDGCGMAEEVCSKIFNPFFTTKRGKGGTGLGMHIVYNLVTQRLGGEIECKSSPGNGAKFIIRIPLPSGDCIS